MDKHIVNLINNNSRVVIPDFGAFIVKQVNPKKIVFNEFLKYNDGLLIDYICKTDGADKEKVVKSLEEFVKNSFKTIDTGGRVTIQGLGTLYKDNLGKIEFEQVAGIIGVDDGTRPPVEKSRHIEVIQPEKKDEKPKPEGEPKQEKKQAEEEKPRQKQEKEEIKTEQPKKSEEQKKTEESEPSVKNGETKKSEEKSPLREFTTDRPDEKQEQVETDQREIEKTAGISKAETKPPLNNPPKEQLPKPAMGVPTSDGEKKVHDVRNYNRKRRSRRHRSSGKAALWIIAVLLVAVIVFFVFLVNDQKTVMNKIQPDDIKVLPEDADLFKMPADDDIVEEQMPERETKLDEPRHTADRQSSLAHTEPKAIAGKRYYIVAGSFQYEKNADKYMLVLQNNGYPSEKFGAINGMHLVSFNSFADKTQAVTALEKIRDEFEPKAWMIRY